jgi:hypothetical protein
MAWRANHLSVTLAVGAARRVRHDVVNDVADERATGVTKLAYAFVADEDAGAYRFPFQRRGP